MLTTYYLKCTELGINAERLRALSRNLDASVKTNYYVIWAICSPKKSIRSCYFLYFAAKIKQPGIPAKNLVLSLQKFGYFRENFGYFRRNLAVFDENFD